MSLSIAEKSDFQMQLISSRMVPFPDSHSLGASHGREALFRTNDGYVLYLAHGSSNGEERIIFLRLREALIWLNEPSHDFGSFWR